MFTVALFTAKTWKQPKWPSTKEPTTRTVHDNGISATKKKERMPFVVMRMDLEMIKLSEVRQMKYTMRSLICGIEKERMQMNYVQDTKRPTDLREGIYGCWEEGCGGRDSEGVWGGHEHAAIFKMDNQQGPTV